MYVWSMHIDQWEEWIMTRMTKSRVKYSPFIYVCMYEAFFFLLHLERTLAFSHIYFPCISYHSRDLQGLVRLVEWIDTTFSPLYSVENISICINPLRSLHHLHPLPLGGWESGKYGIIIHRCNMYVLLTLLPIIKTSFLIICSVSCPELIYRSKYSGSSLAVTQPSFQSAWGGLQIIIYKIRLSNRQAKIYWNLKKTFYHALNWAKYVTYGPETW